MMQPEEPAPNTNSNVGGGAPPETSPSPEPTVPAPGPATDTVDPAVSSGDNPDTTSSVKNDDPPKQPASSDDVVTPAPKSGKKRWFLPAIIAAALVVLGGGYVFGFYLPNTPSNVYKSGLTNTAKGYDKLVNYVNKQTELNYKGFDTSGSAKVSASGAAADISFTSQSDGKNSTGSLTANLMGQKLSANVRSITAKGQTNPDIYFQLNGVKKALESYGLNAYSSLDGQWVVIDHTMLDSLASGATGSTKTDINMPTAAQVEDALAKVGVVNKQYIFTTDTGKAVLVNKKSLGTSTQDGRKVYGYTVGYDKSHLKDYVSALGSALDNSKLNDWAKKVNDGKSISSTMDISGMKNSIDTANGGYTFTMYVDAGTKLIRQLHFPDTTDPVNNYLNLGLNYTGGSAYPFVLSGHLKDGSDTTDYKLTATLDTGTNKGSLSFNFGGTTSGSKYTVSGNADFTPSNKSITVTAPSGAKSLTELMGSLGRGGSGVAPANPYTANSSLFTLTQ